jgi:hypothetical protein
MERKKRFMSPNQYRLAVKDLIFAHHCYHESMADWCVRLTDDVYMHKSSLQKFLDWLAKRGDPKLQVMAFGNCLDYPFWRAKQGWFLQGGSGWVLSRIAAGRFLEFGEKWVLGMDIWEDFYFAEALTRLGLTAQDCDCPFFLGRFMRERKWRLWNWSDPRVVSKCPDIVTPSICGSRLFPYRDVVFHHAVEFPMTQRSWNEWMAAVPHDAMCYCRREELIICRVTP